jgi:hypothetical protein
MCIADLTLEKAPSPNVLPILKSPRIFGVIVETWNVDDLGPRHSQQWKGHFGLDLQMHCILSVVCLFETRIFLHSDVKTQWERIR